MSQHIADAGPTSPPADDPRTQTLDEITAARRELRDRISQVDDLGAAAQVIDAMEEAATALAHAYSLAVIDRAGVFRRGAA